MNHRRNILGGFLFAAVIAMTGCGDGILELNAPSLSAEALGEQGRNVAFAGVGLVSQPATLALTVPAADPGDILDARLRWVGRAATSSGDDTIVINGVEHTGVLLESYSVGGDLPWVFFYELDIAPLVGTGTNLLALSGVDLDAVGPSISGSGVARSGTPTARAAGAGAVVTYVDATSPWTTVHLLDPREFIHHASPGYETGSVWSVPVGMSDEDRSARFVIFAGDCVDARTDEIWWDMGTGPPPANLVGAGGHVEYDALWAGQGDNMDVVARNTLIPAGESRFDYQLASPVGGDEILHFLGVLCTDGDVAPPVVSGPRCVMSRNQWRHQIRMAVSGRGGPAALPPGDLEAMLETVRARTALDWTGGDGVFDLVDARDILRNPARPYSLSAAASCRGTESHYLALLLNYAQNGAIDAQGVDTTGDGSLDSTFGEAIDRCEVLLANANTAACRQVKKIARAVNSMPSFECPY